MENQRGGAGEALLGGGRSPCSVSAFRVGPCDVGLGVFAIHDIPAGAWLMTFEGPLVGAEAPLADGPLQSYLLQVELNCYVDPNAPARWINHSCQPNSGLSGGMDLVALEPIDAGQEIRFDYSTTMFRDPWTMSCTCGAPSCRGLIEAFERLPSALQEHYLSRGVVSDFILRWMASGGELDTENKDD